MIATAASLCPRRFDNGARPPCLDDTRDQEAGLGQQRPQFGLGAQPGVAEDHQHAQVQMGTDPGAAPAR